MKQFFTKKLIMLLLMMVGVNSAWAEEKTVSFDFENENSAFNKNLSRITVAIEDNADLNSKVVGFTCANNAQNGYSQASLNLADYISDIDKATSVNFKMKYYNTTGGRAILSFRDATVNGAHSKTTYNPAGSWLRIGSDKSNAFVNASNKGQSKLCNKWLVLDVTVDVENAKVSYSICDLEGNIIASESGIDSYNAKASKCSQIDLFGYINNSHCAMIDDITVKANISTSAYADFSIKYVDANGTEIKEASTSNAEVGKAPTLAATVKSPIYANDKKYIYASDDANQQTVAANGSTVVTVTFREAETYTLNAKYEGNIISTSQVFEGDNGNVYVPYYQFVDGTLYKNPTVDKGTRSYGQVSVSNVTADTDINVSYTADDNQNVVFFAEAENISTLKPYEDQYTQIRMSNGKVGYAAEDGAVVATLPSGKFTIECSTRAGETSFFTGDVNVFTISSTGSVVTTTSEEFELSAATDITVNAGSNKSYFDYVLIRKTGEAKATCTVSSVGWATFCAPADFEVANADEVYYAKSVGESSVLLTALEAGAKVKAGEGVLVKTEGEHSFALASDATAIEGNLLIGAASATELGEGEAYILANQDGNAVFALCSAGTIAAGKAYLPASIAGAPTLQFVFDNEATSIQSATEATVCNPQATGSYNLAGQRVSNGYKGIVVKNGVKVLVK